MDVLGTREHIRIQGRVKVAHVCLEVKEATLSEVPFNYVPFDSS
jgi:hypothetical protein